MVRPHYGHSTLADLMPSIGAHLGVGECTEDLLGLPSSRRYVVVLIDGLGWHLIRRSLREAPYLAGLLGDGRELTAGVPSTTVTSLTSLGTGLPPGQHGLVGYSFRVPDSRQLLNALAWDADVDPLVFQPKQTFFERAASCGVEVSSVGLERFATSGLTRAALRGPRFIPIKDEFDAEARIELIREAVTTTGSGATGNLVYAYERRLDHAGHVHGCDSATWRAQLSRIDRFCEQLREALPDEVAVIITGDHGMVDVPDGRRLIVEDQPELSVGVNLLAGEGRFRQLYLSSGSAGDAELVAARWAEVLGDRAWVRTRSEAIDDGWFGPVEPAVLERYGQVVVAMRDDWAVMSRRYPRELSLIGMHGSLTPAEMTVPLFCD